MQKEVEKEEKIGTMVKDRAGFGGWFYVAICFQGKFLLVPKRWVSDRHLGVAINEGTPKSSILIGFSTINHLFGDPPVWNPPILTSWKLKTSGRRWTKTSALGSKMREPRQCPHVRL